MNNKLKIALGVVAGLFLIVLLGAGGGYTYISSGSYNRLHQDFSSVKGKDIPIPFPLAPEEIEALRQEKLAAMPAVVAVEPLPVGTEPPPPVDPLAGVDLDAIAMERAVARGKNLIESRLGCGECHGMDGGGKLVADAQPVWTWYAPNITKGGRTKDYKPSDWDRIIRHGVKPDGTPATMPSVDFMSLADQEVSDLAAYFSSQPAIEVQQPDIAIGPIGMVLLATGTMPISAEEIDHAKDHLIFPPPAAVDLPYGEHVASTCVGCHRTDFSGGPIKQGPPDWPPAANLTPTGLQGWTEEDFIRVFHEGKKKDGTDLKVPMADVRKMKITDTDLKAVWLYLSQLPPKPTGE